MLKHYRPYGFTNHFNFRTSLLATKRTHGHRSHSSMRGVCAALAVTFFAGYAAPKPASAQSAAGATDNGAPSAEATRNLCIDTFRQKDYVKAAPWCQKAARQGSAAGQYLVALIYSNGTGVPKDDAQAMVWARKAAEQGLSDAQAMIAIMYIGGIGVKADYEQARMWARKAADQGSAVAQYHLGTLYASGRGGAQDDVQAMTWFRKAAAQGNADAQGAVGGMYENGRAVARDHAQALLWLGKAADQGNPDAKQLLDQLRKADNSSTQSAQTVAPSTPAQQTQQSQLPDARSPSDNEIIQAVKDRLKHEALDSIRAEYAGVDKMTTDPMSMLQAKSKAAVSVSLECSMNAPKDRPACLEKAKAELLAERSARIKKLQNSDMDAEFVYSVQDKKNYEGNYVAFVNLRQRGSDKTFQLKLLLQLMNGAWIIKEKTEKEMR